MEKHYKNKIKKPLLVEVINYFHGIEELARKLDTSFPNISIWLRTDQKIPIKHAITIEILTNGKFKAKQFRPDIMHDFELIKAC